MEPRPIRMPDELWDALEEDAKAHNRMTAEHVRHICREYLEEDTRPVADRLQELEQRLARLESLEQRVERLEAGQQEASGGPEAREEAARGESTQTVSVSQPPDPEPIETIEDVLLKARQEHGQYDESREGKRRLTAARAALETIREQHRVPQDDLRERLVAEYAPSRASEEVWWAETIQPTLRIATEWGLVVSLSGKQLEWVGPPANEI